MKHKTLISIQITLWSCIIIILVSIFSYTIYQDFKRESVGTFSNNDEAEYIVKMGNTKSIKIDFVSEEVEVFISNEKDIKIIQAASYNLKEEDRLRISTSGKTISIDKQNTKHFFNFVNTINKRETIIIYIPENYSERLEIKTVSGNINLQDLGLEKLKCKSTSGYIEIENLQVKEDLEVDTVSGGITLDQIKVNLIDTHTTSGSIKLYEVVAEEIENATTSGDIEVKGTCNYLKNNTTSGRLKIKLDEMSKEISASSVSGNVNLEIPENNGFELKYSTVSGDLKSEFELDEYIYKDRNAKITVKTTSGDLNIKR